MSEPTSPDDDRQRRIEEAMAEYLIAADAGRPPASEAFLARYPDLRDELAGFLADLSVLAGLVTPLRSAGAAPPGLAAALETEATLPISGMTAASGAPETGPTTTVGHQGGEGSPGGTHVIDPASATATADAEATATFGPGTQTTDAPSVLPDGTRVRYFGDYELIKELGRGGMGVVYKARQISLNRPVALKMIRSAALASDDDLRRFQNEAEVVASLDHPNIVPILEVGDHDGQRYFSMKLIGGTSVDKKLADYITVPREAAKLLQKAALAVHHAHQRGILHRDLKPSNIVLDERGEPFVTDFGLAKRADGDNELTHSGLILGTPAYMAPEQASGRRGAVTTASDVYGLGAVLYALLTGRAPFGGASIAETLEQVRESTPARPSSINPRTPRDLEVICLTCLEKDPARRYASMQALADDLARYLAGEPIASRPVGNLTRFWMWCRRNPSLAGSLGAAAAALVAVVIFALLYADRKARLAAVEADKAREQKLAANEISILAKDLRMQRDTLKLALVTSNQRLATLYFERGQSAFEKGQTGRGLLWMVEIWRSAVAAGDPGWQHTARANLAAWQSHEIAIKAVFSHQREIDAVAFSPDGKTVLTSSFDNTARLWDAASGKPIGLPIEHQSAVMSVAFSPDGKAVITGSWDKTARLWDAASGKPIGSPLAHQDAVRAVAFSPDGRAVLTASDDGTARLWDAATGKPIAPPLAHQGAVRCVAFSPDGKIVLTGSDDKMARLWDAASGKPIGPPLPHQDSVLAVAFSPNGKAILTGSGDNTARLWDAATGKPIGSPLAHQGLVVAVAFSPDGKAVLTGSYDKTARLWDVATGKPIGPPLEHKGIVGNVAFSPDGKAILTGSSDNTARLWDAACSKPIGPLMEHPDFVTAVAFSPDGKAVLTGCYDGTARLWDAAPGKSIGPILPHQDAVRAVAFSPGGKAVLTGSDDNTARLWDAVSGRPIGPPLASEVGAVAFSPDGKAVLTGLDDNTARLWDPTTGKLIGPPLAHPGPVSAVAFSPDGKTVLTGSQDCTARLWDPTTGKPVGPPLEHHGFVRAVAFSPDGKTILTGCQDHTARLWDAAAGKPIGPPLAHKGIVWAVAFSPDGKTVLTGSDDCTARLWDSATGQPIGPLLAHKEFVASVAFSPDGKTVLTGSYDKTARLWDAATGKPIGSPMVHQGEVESVAFSPDGKSVLTGSLDKTARLWPVSELPDDLPRVADWVGVVTGLELDEQGSVHALDNAAWRQRRERLDRESGPPDLGRRWRLDPILFGPEPTARARAWIERQRWTEAEAACDEVVLARPFDADVVLERARFHAARSRPDKADDDFLRAYALGSRDLKLIETISRSEVLFQRALAQAPDSAAPLWSERGEDHARQQRWAEAAADYAQIVRLKPEDLTLRHRQILLLIAAGELDQLQRARSDVLDRFGRTAIAGVANDASRCYSLAPGMDDRLDALVRLAELGADGATASEKERFLTTLGAALYRAARFEDAIRCLDEGIQLKGAKAEPRDWVFLAMAHHRLGHRELAHRHLESLRNCQPSTDPDQFWTELEIRLLRSEAEATILYDPIFPADPFASRQ